MIPLLAAIVALLPSYLIRYQILGIPTTLLEILVIIFILVGVSRLTQESYKKIKNLGWLNTAIVLFVIAGIVSTIISPQNLKALGQLKAFILEPVLLFYAIIITIKSKDQLHTLLRWLFISVGVISLFGLLQYVTFVHLPLRFWGTGTEVRRITSVFEYPNALSLFLGPLLGFFTTLWLYNYQILKNQWVVLAGLGSMGLTLLLTFSRGAWIATGLGLLLILAKRFGAKKTMLPALLLILAILLIPSVQQRLFLGLSDASTSAHWDLMQIGIGQIIMSPILGNGLHGFEAMNVSYPHNIFLNFWLEMGLLGLVAFIWIIYLTFQKYRQTPQPLLLAACVYFMILLFHGLVDVPYFKNDLSILFWFVLSLVYL